MTEKNKANKCLDAAKVRLAGVTGGWRERKREREREID